MLKKQRLILVIILTMLVTSFCFVMSDTPDKVYLNPFYVDIIVFMAGLYLLVDGFLYLEKKRFYSNVLRVAIGTAIITIHFMQFIFDLTRAYI